MIKSLDLESLDYSIIETIIRRQVFTEGKLRLHAFLIALANEMVNRKLCPSNEKWLISALIPTRNYLLYKYGTRPDDGMPPNNFTKLIEILIESKIIQLIMKHENPIYIDLYENLKIKP